MAKKVRFPLQMNGTDVRTIEKLRDNFDLESVLGYFANGKLVTWLRDRYYDNEAMAVEALAADDFDLNQKLMTALGVTKDTGVEEIDMETIQRHNEKLMKLRQFTDDQTIIADVDHVAFNQDDLLDILDEGAEKIYLCEGEFNIPLSVKNVTYVGLRNPIVLVRAYDNVNFASLNIKFVDICFGWDISSITSNDRLYQAERMMEKREFDAAIPLLEQLVVEKNPRAFYVLGQIYEKVYVSEENNSKKEGLQNQGAELGLAYEWIEVGKEFSRMTELLRKLVAKGDKSAMGYLAYYCAIDRDYDGVVKYAKMGASKNDLFSCECLFYLYKNDFMGGNVPENLVDIDQALRYGEKAAELGHAGLADKVAMIYWSGSDGIYINYDKAAYYWKIGAELGNHSCQHAIACCYETEKGVKQDYAKAVYWFEKAISTGSTEPNTQFELGKCYENGWGTTQDYRKAFVLFEKAANAGYMYAQNTLGWMYQNGYGTSQDYNLALYWYEKAGENGLEQGKENAQYIREEMSRIKIDTSSEEQLKADLKRIGDETRSELAALTDELRRNGFFNITGN